MPHIHTEFLTFTETPTILYKHPNYTLYAQNNQLLLLSDYLPTETLITWQFIGKGRTYLVDNQLLIGIQNTNPDDDSWSRGEWHAITLHGLKPEVVDLGNQYFGPENILVTRVAQNAPLVFFTVENGSGYSELVYFLGATEFLSINSTLYDSRDFYLYFNKPQKVSGIISIEHENKFTLMDRDVYAFEDELGTILYWTEPEYSYVGRYYNLTLEDVKLMKSTSEYAGEELTPFMKWKTKEGDYLLGNHRNLIPYESSLWEEEWASLDSSYFYLVSQDRIRVKAFEYDSTSIYKKVIDRAFQLSGEKFINNFSLHYLQFLKNGELAYLSLYDLLHDLLPIEQNKGNISLTPYWIKPIMDENLYTERFERDGNDEQADVAFSYIEVQLPKLDYLSDYNNHSNDTISQELYNNALNTIGQFSNFGDYSASVVLRRIEGNWYVLIDDKLYEYKNEKIELLGNIPVSLSSTNGEGTSGAAAQDFIKIEDNWYFADTYGNRIIKLNRYLEVTDEYELPFPVKLLSKDQQIHIKYLKGWSIFNHNLELITDQEKTFTQYNNEKLLQERYIDTVSYYYDQHNDFHWYADSTSLYIYRVKTDDWDTIFLGHNVNARAKIRIIPYKNGILILKDEYVHIFDRQGNWKEEIYFPLVTSGGLAYYSSYKEGDIYFDQNNKMIYLLQGYRLLEIDIETKNVTTLFHQIFADISAFTFSDGIIYFTMSTNNRFYRNEKEAIYSELIILKVKDTTFTRYLVKGNPQVQEIRAGPSPEIILYEDDENPYYRKKGTLTTIKNLKSSIKTIN